MVQARICSRGSYFDIYAGAHNSEVQLFPSRAFSNVHRRVAAQRSIASVRLDQTVPCLKKWLKSSKKLQIRIIEALHI